MFRTALYLVERYKFFLTSLYFTVGLVAKACVIVDKENRKRIVFISCLSSQLSNCSTVEGLSAEGDDGPEDQGGGCAQGPPQVD